MQGKLTQLKWTSGGGGNRDLAFLIVFLIFGVIFLLKISPYFQVHEQSAIYNKIQTTQAIPKSFLAEISLPRSSSNKLQSERRQTTPEAASGQKHASIQERPLFDGQTVLLQVRSLNSYSSNNATQAIEAQILDSASKDRDLDFTAAIGGKLVGAGNANLSQKVINIIFNELISSEGRSYAVQGQAVGSQDLTPGVDGDYSSGLPSRLAGIAIDRTILAADQIGTAYLFSAIGPGGPGAQQLRTAAMETNQQGSQDISGEATKGLRETPAKIELPAGSVFFVRVRAALAGGHQ